MLTWSAYFPPGLGAAGWRVGKQWTRDRFKSNGTDAFRDTHPLQPLSLCPLLYRKIGMMIKFMAFKNLLLGEQERAPCIFQTLINSGWQKMHCTMCYIPKEFENQESELRFVRTVATRGPDQLSKFFQKATHNLSRNTKYVHKWDFPLKLLKFNKIS